MERLPAVFRNIEPPMPLPPPTLVPDPDEDSVLRPRFRESSPKLLSESEDRELRRDNEEDRRTRPHRIWLSSSFMRTSSSMRRCRENSLLPPYTSSSRCILARFANLRARRSCVLTSSSRAASGVSPSFAFSSSSSSSSENRSSRSASLRCMKRSLSILSRRAVSSSSSSSLSPFDAFTSFSSSLSSSSSLRSPRRLASSRLSAATN
mmetsp:Transcript_23189/g.64275  ORF Transcript_23189/g.64275 Transcript_23189/m.64275 type:complete len:207 (+) Transcript_23189:747-1367(+)